MKGLKYKLIIVFAFCTVIFSAFSSLVYARNTNENLEIVRLSDGNYLIYLTGLQNREFEFTFSNNQYDNTQIPYMVAGFDNASENANRIAYVNTQILQTRIFDNPTYLFIRVGSNYMRQRRKNRFNRSYRCMQARNNQ